jgi:RimJ/RimL family protein N-acetyltransferase
VNLRPLTADDLWVLERQADEPEAGGVFNWSGYRDIAGTRRRFEENRLLGPDGGCLVVQLPEAVAGTVVWSRVTYGMPAWSCWNIGISLLPEFRYRGHGGNAQRLLAAYLFDTTPVEGVIRSAQFREGRWRNLQLYAVLRDEFKVVPRT